MSNRVRIAHLVVLSLIVVFACGTSLAMAQSTQEETTAPGTQEKTAAPDAKEKTDAQSTTQSTKEGTAAQSKKDNYQFIFPPEEYSSTGTNSYFVLQPGYVLEFKGIEDNQTVDLTITVLDQTEVVDDVETRVVEEVEKKDGKLYEISRNYFVVGQKTNSVYYFGEDVDFYNENGEVIGHDGSWRSGENGARYGLMMPGIVKVGQRYYQEVAPGVALDRAEHVSKTANVNTPAGRFRNTLKVRETTPLEPDVEEFKFYAKGVGLVKTGELRLTRYGTS